MKPKSEIMKEMRKRRKKEGLVQFTAWVTLEQKKKLQELLIAEK